MFHAPISFFDFLRWTHMRMCTGARTSRAGTGALNKDEIHLNARKSVIQQ